MLLRRRFPSKRRLGQFDFVERNHGRRKSHLSTDQLGGPARDRTESGDDGIAANVRRSVAVPRQWSDSAATSVSRNARFGLP